MVQRIVCIVVCGIGVLAGSARAQIFIEEGKVSVDASGGDRINRSLIVHNTSADELKVKVYWEDFKYKAPYDGAKDFLPAGTTPLSASRFVTFSPTQLTLPAYGTQQINYTISIPDPMDKGYYGVLFLERSVGHLQDASAVNVVSRVGCLFFIEPKDKVKSVVLGHIALKASQVSGQFMNQGNVILTPKITYYMMDQGGVPADRGEIKNLYVPAGESAPWDINLPSKLKPGQYTLVVNADLADTDVAVKEVNLTKDVAGTITIEGERD